MKRAPATAMPGARSCSAACSATWTPSRRDARRHAGVSPVAAAHALVIAMLLAAMLLATPASAAEPDPHAAHRAQMQQPSGGAGEARIRVPHADLVDAHGAPFAFSAAAFGDRVVVIDFVYTTCTTICPALTATMATAQARLAPHLGSEVMLVSVTVDPARDTPEALRAYAARVRAGEHWLWLTGNAAQVDRVLRGFGIAPGAPEEHPPVLLVGRPAQGRWLRWVGIPSPKAVIEATQGMIASAPSAADAARAGTTPAATAASPAGRASGAQSR